MDIMPDGPVHAYIIDPKRLKRLKSSEGYEKELSIENNNCYMKKYQTFIENGYQPQEELSEFIENYMDDKLQNYYTSQDRS